MSTQPQIAKLINQLRGDQPHRREAALVRNRYSLQTSLDKQACVEAGIDPEDPDSCTQWYFPKYGVAVIDLGGNYGGE